MPLPASVPPLLTTTAPVPVAKPVVCVAASTRALIVVPPEEVSAWSMIHVPSLALVSAPENVAPSVKVSVAVEAVPRFSPLGIVLPIFRLTALA